MKTVRSLPTMICTIAVLLAAGCTSPRIRTVEAFEAAVDGGDLAAAAAHLADDPRVWWGERSGAGSPWTLGAEGRWRAWDMHFRGTTKRTTPWHDEVDRVWADMEEVNEYYLLTERGAGAWRRTYFFDGGELITGTMIGPVDDPQPVTSRFDEFEAWALEHHAAELAYLMPDGEIDPTGDRAERFRALLNEWRESAGLARIE